MKKRLFKAIIQGTNRHAVQAASYRALSRGKYRRRSRTAMLGGRYVVTLA